jgi:three-Cys-motif partner protein
MSVDRWEELCKLVERDDGLPVREVRHWTREKLWFWNRYVDITTTAMVDKPQWQAGLVYVDLFGGPGVLRMRNSGKRIPGSPLVAAYAPKPFRKILVCELDPELASACEKRLAATPASGRFEVFGGDCNQKVHEMIARIPPRALTLAFVDPEGLHANFETIRTLSSCGQVDLLVLLADGYDFSRNALRYRQEVDSNADRVLGEGSGWREKYDHLKMQSRANRRQLIADVFCDQLRKLGYIKFGFRTFRSYARNLPLYRLIVSVRSADV